MTGDLLPSMLGIALVAAAAVFALMPFARGARSEPPPSSYGSSVDRVALYRQVLELEFDRDLGKLSTQDFEQLSAELLAQAGEALREERGNLSAVDEEIEAEIAAARAAFAAARRSRQTEAETPVS